MELAAASSAVPNVASSFGNNCATSAGPEINTDCSTLTSDRPWTTQPRRRYARPGWNIRSSS